MSNYILGGLRLIDISLIGIYFLIGGITLSVLTDRIFGNLNKKDINDRSTLGLVLMIALWTSVIMIGAYVLRTIVAWIPCPFDGVYGYEHKRLTELGGGPIIAFALILFMNDFKYSIQEVVYRHVSKQNISYDT